VKDTNSLQSDTEKCDLDCLVILFGTKRIANLEFGTKWSWPIFACKDWDAPFIPL